MRMMDEIHSNDSQAVNWKYLPNKSTFFQYLNMSDLKELSIACKTYRKQLEREILKNLRLDRWALFFTDTKHFRELNGEKAIDHLLNLLEIDLENKYHLVKEITFCNTFHEKYAKKIVRLFPHIIKLKFSTDFKDGYELGLLTILNGMKNLENVEFFVYDYGTLNFDIGDQMFSKSLKSIIVEVEGVDSRRLSIFNSIDSSFSNLTTLSITSSKMLSNISANMPNLKDVRICSNSELDENLLIKFIKLNSQLARLDVRLNNYSREILVTILHLKHLSCLYIDCYMYQESELGKDFPLNYSIKKLKFDRDTHQIIISNLIKNCQSLNSVEFCDFDFEEKHLNIWDGLNLRINTLKFNNCYFDTCLTYIQKLAALNFFNRATFITCDSVESIIRELGLHTLNSHRLTLNTHGNPKSCTITTIR